VRLFDSHAHLTDERFGTEIGDVLARAVSQGVADIVSIASDIEDAEAAIELAGRHRRPRIRCTVGIHPHVARLCTSEALGRIRDLSHSDLVVALGEMGLDFYYENAPRDEQIAAFGAQIELAEQLGLPVVVHSREANTETARIVREAAGRVTGVLHCFGAGDEVLEAGLAADWYVSFSGLVSFKNFTGGQQVRRVPESRLLVETDSPYLAPVPLRGRRNEPANVRYVVERLAEIRGEDPERLAESTYQNACRFYALDG
jgi:TatD DNase family protein